MHTFTKPSPSPSLSTPRNGRRCQILKGADRQRSVKCAAAGFLYKVQDEPQPESHGDYDGVVMTGKSRWYEELAHIRDMEISGKCVSILGMDSPDTVVPPTWCEIMQLRDAFMEGGARSVDYVHYRSDAFDDVDY